MVVLAPLFLIVAIAIKATSRGPVFYRQDRLGVNGQTFSIYKFRTMIDGAEHLGLKMNVIAGDNRITRVGRLLRDWSLDELPQVINVITGEMSLVGPRPAIVPYLEKYTSFEKQRLLVPPGITGWAQINGRNSLSWPQRIEKDVWYVENRSLSLNIWIMLKTIPVLITRAGLYALPEATATEVHSTPEPLMAASDTTEEQRVTVGMS